MDREEYAIALAELRAQLSTMTADRDRWLQHADHWMQRCSEADQRTEQVKRALRLVEYECAELKARLDAYRHG